MIRWTTPTLNIQINTSDIEIEKVILSFLIQEAEMPLFFIFKKVKKVLDVVIPLCYY